MPNDDIIVQMAQDVGYIRGVIEPIADADLPARMTFVEGQQKVQNERMYQIEQRRTRMFKSALAFGTMFSALVSAAAGWAFIFHG